MSPTINTLTQTIAARDARIKELYASKITCSYKKDKNKYERQIVKQEEARRELQDLLDALLIRQEIQIAV